MNYLSSRELSEKWGISQRRLLCLAKAGRIPGAKLYGRSWLFPEASEKPADGRTKADRSQKLGEPEPFRYAIFEHKEASSFQPPLSQEELTLKAVSEAFHACRFQEAEGLLGRLPKRIDNRYIRITALYCKCMVGITLCDTRLFFDSYGGLKAELQEDFPHKEEMSEYLHGIDAVIGEDQYYAQYFSPVPAYAYHESFLPHLCSLSALWLPYGQKPISSADFMAYELNCLFLEKTDNYADLQALHIYLACAYSVTDRKEECRHHFHRAFVLAEKYDLFFTLAVMQYYYSPKALEDALEGFSEDFKNRLAKCNHQVYKICAQFAELTRFNSLYQLPSNDYLFVLFAAQGLTNKEVAQRIHQSAGNVGKHYSAIYAQLGVKNKAELTALYRRLEDNIGEGGQPG